MLLWEHLAPVCGGASRARNIQREPADPLPLRSSEFLDGLPDLSAADRERVRLANRLYEAACFMSQQATLKGIFVTMENPSSSYFLFTCWVLRLMRADFQSCMYGGARNKWTCAMANFKQISAMDVVCAGSHKHLPWRFAKDSHGKQVWATFLHSQYPRKLCVVIVSLLLRCRTRGVTLKLRWKKRLRTPWPLLNYHMWVQVSNQSLRRLRL